MIPQGAFITKVNPKLINTISWIGTVALLLGPYFMNQGKIGYILCTLGIVGISPAVFKQRQWNLVILNISGIIGYSLHIFNIL